MAEQTASGLKRTRGIGLLDAIALGPSIGAALFSVGIHLLMLTGFGLRAAVFAMGPLCALIGFGYCRANGVAFSKLRLRRLSGAELCVFGFLLVMFVALWDRAALRSLSIPHISGVDPAHHGALVTYLVRDDRLPRFDPRLAGLSNYPVGAHLVAASLSRIFSITPLSALWITALGGCALAMVLVVWTTRQMSSKKSWATVGVSVTVWLVGWRLGIGLVTADFFFAQTVSLAFVVAGVGVCVAGARSRRLRSWLPVAILFAVAAAWAYPQQGLVVPLSILVATSPGSWAVSNASFWRRRRVQVGCGAVAVLAGIAIFRAVRNSPYLSAQAITGVGEGAAISLSVRTFGGLACVILTLYAIVELAVGAVRGNRPARVLIAALVVPAGTALALALLRISWIAGLPVTRYRIVKNVYTAFPFLAIGCGFAIETGVESTRSTFRRIRASRRRISTPTSLDSSRRRFDAVVLVFSMIAALAFVVRPQHLATVTAPLVDRGEYELSIDAATAYPPDEVGIVGDELGPYVLWWVGLRRTIPPEVSLYPEVPRMSRWATWPDDSPERYLLVDAVNAASFSSRPGVVVLAQRRGAVLLTKSTPEQ